MNNNELDPWFNMIPNSALEELANPIAHEIGQGLGGIASLIFNPARKLGIISRKNIEDFEEKIYSKTNKIPQENRDNSKQGLALKALEDSSYQLESETLQEMFSTLIASSLDSRKNKDVHPYYSSILKDLISLDAQIFKRIYDNGVVPIVNVSLVRPKTHHTVSIIENIILTPGEVFDESSTIKTLQVKGLIDIYPDDYLVDDKFQKLYEKFEKSDMIKVYTDQYKSISEEINLVPQSNRGSIYLSPLGRDFGRAVIGDQ